MTKERDALKLALEALEYISSHYMSLPKIGCMALAALEEALAEQPAPPPECKTDSEKTAFAFGWWKALEENRKQPAPQEPVAYSYTSRITGAQGFSHHPMPRFIDSESWDIKPLYTFSPASKQWVGLTDEEVAQIADSEWEEAFARLIEAKLKEKNA